MDSNRRIDFDDDDCVDFGTGDAQHSSAALLQQTLRQQQEIDQLRLKVQSNTEFLESFMTNNSAPGVGNSYLNPHSFNSPSGMMMQGDLNYSAPTAMLRPPSTNPELRLTMAEAHRRGMTQENQTPQQQPLIQHQIQPYPNEQASSAMMLQNQMFRLTDPEPPRRLMDPQMLDNMLHQSRGMPHEAHALFSSQIASNLMSMRNPLDFVSTHQQFQSTMRAMGPEKVLLIPGNKSPIEPFPEKLHRMLTETEKSGQEDIIGFTADGRSFEIRKPSRFFQEIVPIYFKQSKLSSFKRQLNLYGFELVISGLVRGAYSHPSFQKDRPDLCRTIRRRDVKFVSGSDLAKLEPNTMMPSMASFADPSAPKDTDTCNQR